MITHSSQLESAVLAVIPSVQRLDVGQIYGYVEQIVNLTADDLELIVVQGVKTELAWHRNVRNVLQSLKQRGKLVNQPKGYWHLPPEIKGKMLNAEKAWEYAVVAAAKCLSLEEIWYSPIELREYKVVRFDQKAIEIQRLSGGEDVRLGRKDFTRAALMMNAAGGTMARRSLNRVVAKEAAIVFLYPHIAYSENGEQIITNDISIERVYGDTFALAEREVINDCPEDRANELRRVRKGQHQLKKKLLQVYSGQCCVTGTNLKCVLIAAHIEPHALSGINISTNALLLRSDVHILYHEHLIAIEPETLTIYVSPELTDSLYWPYNGEKLRFRNDDKYPNKEKLKQRWNQISWFPRDSA